MITGGSGASGLAIVSLQGSHADAATGEPLRRLPLVWMALEDEQLDKTWRVCLFRPTEKITSEALHRRGAEFVEEARAKNIRACVAIGTPVLRVISPVHGRAAKLLGATIQTEAIPYIVPVDTAWGLRALRAYDWQRAMVRFVRRAHRLAKGEGHIYQFPPIAVGEGANSLAALTRIYEAKEPVGLDIETTGKDWRHDPITAIGFATGGLAVSTPLHSYTSRLHGAQVGLRCAATRRLIIAILGDARIPKLLHNGLFDLSVLRTKGFEVAGEVEDTYLAHKIAHPDLFHNLQFCLAYEHAVAPWKTMFDLERAARREGDDWADTAPVPLMTYNAQDAAAEIPLWERLQKRLDEVNRGRERYAKLKELAGLAADMQAHGVRIDLGARNALLAECQGRLEGTRHRWSALRSDMPPISGPGSTKGIRHLFFETLKAPVIARSMKTQKEQLSAAVLLDYASGEGEVAQAAWLLFEYRKVKKVIDGFLAPLTADRVYAKPNPAGTRGSRFSYSEPNLQQWSKQKTVISPLTKQEVVLAPSLRHLVCPDEGMVLGEHDYNALEVRIMAYAANLTVWLEWLAAGVDMHTEHASLMFGRKVSKGDPLRQIVKVLTFARFYNFNRSVGQVLKALKPSMPTLTESFLQELFARFDKARPEIVAWQKSVEAQVKERGYVELPLSGARQYHSRKKPDINAALSFGIQSTGGDLINPAALRIRARLDATRGERILLNVHDALLWQAKPERVHAVAAIVREEMERPVDLWGYRGVSFPTECKVGPNWRDLEGIAQWEWIN